MALKIFCDVCQKYIRDMNSGDDLTGEEICTDCKDHLADLFKEIDRVAKRAISVIQTKQSNAQAKIEEAMRRVVEGGEDS